jgi:hypothetical protein
MPQAMTPAPSVLPVVAAAVAAQPPAMGGGKIAIANTRKAPVSIYKLVEGDKTMLLHKVNPGDAIDLTLTPNCRYMAVSIDKPDADPRVEFLSTELANSVWLLR